MHEGVKLIYLLKPWIKFTLNTKPLFYSLNRFVIIMNIYEKIITLTVGFSFFRYNSEIEIILK